MPNKRIFRLTALTVFLWLLSGCRQEHSPYDGVENYGKENVEYTSLAFDTLRLDARYTSLAGQWHMKDSV
jgi:hypothetical protein